MAMQQDAPPPQHPSLAGSDSERQQALSFGNFVLYPTERRLECSGHPVRIGSRAFDILLALLEQAGEIVPHRALIARAWPRISVEEANLRVHIAELRRLLAAGGAPHQCITNVPSRGYAITVPVRPYSHQHQSAPQQVPPVPAASMSTTAQRLLGRDEDLATLESLVESHRLVSIVGAGGIGKTAIALRLMQLLQHRFGGVSFADLSSASSAEDVVSLLSTASELPRDPGYRTDTGKVAKERPLLIVLDGCERMVDAVAGLTARLRCSAPESHILLTSRAATRSADEQVHVVPPLHVAPDRQIGQATAGAPAVELFMAAARAGGYRFEPTNEDLPLVASICERLDGNPLALEIVGSRVATHGLQGTAGLIENPEWLLTQTLRGSPARHRTIAAMLAWSYDLLIQKDRQVLGRLSELGEDFSMSAAEKVSLDAEISPCDVQLAVSRLLEQSLLHRSRAEGETTYRLPNLVKLFVRGKPRGEHPFAELERRRSRVAADDNQDPSRKHRYSTVQVMVPSAPRSVSRANMRVI
jgi:predicted ATPase/DNA-binding winged helix-turn-helix (wHTH) protein